MKWTSALVSSVLFAGSGLASELLETREGSSAPCRCFPGESCWPKSAKWTALNQTVGGRLVRVIPPGAVCFPSFNGIPTYSAEQCAEVINQWGNSTWM